jgi:hypothetical protein
MSSESAVRSNAPATADEQSAEWQRMCDLMAQAAEPLARFNARKEAEERLHDEYAGRAVAYREEWDGDSVRMLVVRTADTLEELMAVVDELPVDGSRLTLVSLPGPDEIEVGGVTFHS